MLENHEFGERSFEEMLEIARNQNDDVSIEQVNCLVR